ncbi:ATP-binding protein [Streptomyces sp. XD-27]|uniref:ATP-binding protein n=1 Tax=Streptomyces sp. XD-27 TaxID=3062779 RepID=UPI0026F476AB|nr:ATP-binding protein [Streptomyces sp. XD-27]WKX72722.1 sensor histidine kinase [Streptomyces sp. XD-27]
MTDLPLALTACLGLGSLVAVALVPFLVRARRHAARARSERDAAAEEVTRLTARVTALTEETRHLVANRLPALTSHLRHSHVPVPGLADPGLLGSETDRDHRAVLDLVSRAVLAERHRVDEAAQATVRGTTTVMQAKSYQLQDLVNAMQHRYDDPRIIADTVALSRLNEQILRRIQATGVVCGATAGLTRADSHLGDIVVGAQSRIVGPERVRVTSRLTDPIGVVARAAEPVAIAVAELLANAVHHSHGTLEVDVSLHQSDSGAVIVIDDAGVGMHPEEIDYATRMMSGQHPVLLTELGDPPRAGFAAIGRLVRQFGFGVSVDKPAPYGGVRAIVHIPGRLLTILDETTTPMSVVAPLPPRPTTGPADPAHAPRDADTGLPRRRRRAPQPPEDHPIGAARGTGAAAPPPAPRPPAARSPEQTGAVWGSFQRGTASGRAASARRSGHQDAPHPPHPLDPHDGQDRQEGNTSS